MLAANEAISNVLEHGGAGGTLTVRCVSTGVTVEVADAAGLLTPAHLAGAKLDLTGSRGFGLWIIQHLCDEVGLEQAAGGSVLTMRMDPSRHVSRALD
ncbi:Histidine kinase-like ATPase domain-containing protein [Nonomuraea jiangxiensis]|uniref:Histidine kinase-like ATPase domain-containing protein n=1 Tax=Nonomuraea jiangxiensis TaxID=633440 RepID=A0A1G9MN90_9ACTN|nr:Histidine kinase-like ATPase domain-containing protein [Nonomuraea jiangxiensis]